MNSELRELLELRELVYNDPIFQAQYNAFKKKNSQHIVSDYGIRSMNPIINRKTDKHQYKEYSVAAAGRVGSFTTYGLEPWSGNFIWRLTTHRPWSGNLFWRLTIHRPGRDVTVTFFFRDPIGKFFEEKVSRSTFKMSLIKLVMMKIPLIMLVDKYIWVKITSEEKVDERVEASRAGRLREEKLRSPEWPHILKVAFGGTSKLNFRPLLNLPENILQFKHPRLLLKGCFRKWKSEFPRSVGISLETLLLPRCNDKWW